MAACTSQSTRAIFVKSYVISRLQYSCFLYTSLPLYHQNRLHKLIMGCSRFSRGNYGFRINSTRLMSDANLLNHNQLMYKTSAKIIFRILESKQSPLLYDLFRIPGRSCSKISLKQLFKTAKVSKHHYLKKMLACYNDLPIEIKNLNYKKQVYEVY